MQNLEVKDTILKIKKTKTEIKKEPEDSTVNGKKKLKKSICKTELINVLQMKTQ